jgi:hypothetical protein
MHEGKLRTARRTFLAKLGLGIGSTLLAPIADSIYSEALGQVTPRKRVIFFLTGNGLSAWQAFTPLELMKKTVKAGPEHDDYYPDIDWPVLPGEKTYTLPNAFAPVADLRSKMLFVDGLTNPAGGQHSGGYAALSCFDTVGAKPDEHGAPGGVTIDQQIANKLGTGTAMKSILYGVTEFFEPTASRIFASGKGQPLSHIASPALLWKQVFGSFMPPAMMAMMGAPKPRLDKHRVIFDTLKGDISKLQSAFAPSERRKLDQYLAAIAELEQRQSAAPPPASCAAPTASTLTSDESIPIEDKLEAMTEIASLALICGLTNVVGVSAGCGHGHTQPVYKRIHKGTMFEGDGALDPAKHGHDDQLRGPADPTHVSGFKSVYGAVQDIMHKYHMSLIRKMVTTLSGISEGDKTAFDNSVVVYLNDNGEGHHSEHDRWPVVLIGNAGGALKSDGRFLRYPLKTRALGDLYSSVATAVGVPTNDFGSGGLAPTKGPLTEIMA